MAGTTRPGCVFGWILQTFSCSQFSSFWQRHRRDLFRSCLRWTGGRHDVAEEIFSRAAVLALEKFACFRGGSDQERGWLWRLTKNVCIDLHRERLRRREMSLEELLDLPPGGPVRGAGETPEEELLREELLLVLRRAIDDLPVRLRAPVALVVERQMGYREIAESLAITEVAARKRMQLARQLLRGLLASYVGRPAAKAPAACSRGDSRKRLPARLQDETPNRP